MSSANSGPVYLRNPKLVITVPADDLPPNGAGSSADTAMLFAMYADDVIQNGRRVLGNLVGIGAHANVVCFTSQLRSPWAVKQSNANEIYADISFERRYQCLKRSHVLNTLYPVLCCISCNCGHVLFDIVGLMLRKISQFTGIYIPSKRTLTYLKWTE